MCYTISFILYCLFCRLNKKSGYVGLNFENNRISHKDFLETKTELILVYYFNIRRFVYIY